MMTESNSSPNNIEPNAAPSSNRQLFAILTVLVSFAWIVLTALSPLIIWFMQEEAVLTGSEPEVWAAIFSNIGQVVLWLMPLAAATWFWWERSPRHAAVLETWLLAALLPLLWLPLRFFPTSTYPDMAGRSAALQFLGLLVFHLLLLGWRKWRGTAPIKPQRGWLPGLLFTPLLMAGWLYFGSFGGWLDMLLHLLLGLYFGYVIGFLLGHFLLQPLYATSTGPGWDMALGSYGVGGVLAMAGASFGFGGQIILFLFLLPSLAWPLVGSLRMGDEPDGRSWGLAAGFIGFIMAGLLILADVDELTMLLLLDSTELFVQLLQATLLTIVIGRVLGLILWLARNKLPHLRRGWPLKAAAGLVWTAVLILLVLKPNAGFHRDHLLVILSDQADVNAAADIADIDARRQFVYDTLTAHANQTQAPLRQALDRFRIDYQPYYLINAIEVEGGPLVAFWLGRMDGVDRVLHNPELRPLIPRSENVLDLTIPESAPSQPDWNLTMIGADRVWAEFGVRGAGITLGQSDSGVQWDHPELRDSYRGQDGNHDFDWLDVWQDEPLPYDISGHGTHTTATVVGNSVGVAPDAEWFACANLVRNLGSPGKYLTCMEFMLAPYPLDGDSFTDGDATLAADVLNNSWGCPTLEGCDPDALETAVSALRAAGIFVVASAGNDGMGGCNTVADPIALYDGAFSVGAHDSGGTVANFSSRGPVTADGSGRIKPDILAPGEDVLSAVPGDGYARNSGTSMAGPHVAGIVALIWSANPALIGNIDRTEQILVATAVPYDYTAHGIPECGDPAASPNNAVGYGLVNAYEAVKLALTQ